MTYCGHCGEAVDARDHSRCDELLQMEPPRFCAECRRRMVVQVTPARLVGPLRRARRAQSG